LRRVVLKVVRRHEYWVVGLDPSDLVEFEGVEGQRWFD
jgi:hypothetical protein